MKNLSILFTFLIILAFSCSKDDLFVNDQSSDQNAGLKSTNKDANSSVVKEEINVDMPFGQYLECTGDYLGGYYVLENMYMQHNWITKIRNAVIIGYKDFELSIPSGNVYENWGTVSGDGIDNEVMTGHWSLDGKPIAVYQYHFHITTNANGEVTVLIDNWRLDCK